MSGFHGRFDYSVDAKGRVNIPAKFRKVLSPDAGDMFIICRAPNRCLRAYPRNRWTVYETELSSRPETPDALRHKRLLYNTISDSTLDAQGRISVTPAQMGIAGITRDVTLVGHADYIELWDTARYEEYLGDADDFDTVFYQSVEAGLAKR